MVKWFRMAPSFILKMAWRDSRTSRTRLLLFSLSITVGVAALVAIGSFRQSLSQSIDDQARTLVGADLIIESTRPFTTTEEGFLGSIGGAQAREVRLSTMAVFLGRGYAPGASSRPQRRLPILRKDGN